MQIRDVILRQQSKFETKQDRQMFRRAVLTTEGGLQTSSDPLNDVWASRNERRVWHMADGATQPAQVLCRKVSNPYVGLGVIIGYADGSNAKEVLTTDFFLTGAGTNLDGWDDTGPEDLEPGGNKLHWVYTKVITPLATYPDPTGLTVNVIRGDYPYLSARKTYAGSASYALTQNPNAGQHYLAGLYLDAANTLQVVYGASVSTATTAPEPSWPAGAFRLSAVLIDDVQTSIDFDTDIFDRRMAWSDDQAVGGWPFTHILTVSTVDLDADYSTIGAAIAAAGNGDIILLDAGTYTEVLTVNKSISIVGLDPNQTIITTTTADTTTINVTGASVTLRNLTIRNAGGGTTTNALKLSTGASDTIVENCVIEKVSGASTNSNAVKIESGQNHVLLDCFIRSTSGTTRYGVLADTGVCSVRIVGGRVQGQTIDVRTNGANASILLLGPILASPSYEVAAGGIGGEYHDVSANLYIVDNTGIGSGVWLVDESATLRIKYASFNTALSAAGNGDTIFLDSDTYAITTASITRSITIAGNGPEATILQGSNGANAQLLDIAANSITVVFKDLTIDCNAGDQTYGGAIFGDNSGITVILDNAVARKTGGAPTNGFGIGPAAGTWILRNGAKASATVGTSKYGIMNITGAATIVVGPGCEVTGATYDAYGDQSGSSLSIYGGILTSNLMSWAGKLDRSGDTSFERARPNPVINGSFLMWRRGTSFATVADGTYTADMWVYNKTGAMVHTVSQSTDVPTVAQSGLLIPYSLLVDCTTVDGSIAAGDFCFMRTKIEGFNFLHLAQRQFTLSFWVKATKTGIYCVSFSNSGADRSFIVEYTVNAADTWEYKQMTVLASPTAGTWDYTTGIGLALTFTLATGSTYQTTAGAWQTGGYLGTSNQVNATDSTSNDFRLALVRLEPGLVATPFILPDYEQERARCLRYAYVIDASSNIANQGQGGKTSTTNIQLTFQHPVPMRAATAYSSNITGYTGGNPGTTTVAVVNYATNNFFTITGALTVARANGNTLYTALDFTAGTSWSDTAGNLATLRVGPSVVLVLSSDL